MMPMDKINFSLPKVDIDQIIIANLIIVEN